MRKQQKSESVEKYFRNVKELADNCDFGDKEDSLVREVFVANILDEESQRQLLGETVEPQNALKLTTN